MKTLMTLLLSASLAATLYSRDIRTLSGTTYKNVTVNDHDAIELVISYEDKDKGTVLRSIPFRDLPDDIKKEFNYSPEAEKEALKIRNAAQKKPATPAQPGQDAAQEESELMAVDNVGAGAVDPNPITNGDSPGEKSWGAEGAVMKTESLEGGRAPGEKEWGAEGEKMKKEALQSGRSPGEKEWGAEGEKIRREGIEE